MTIAADYSSSEIEETLAAVAPILAGVDGSSEESRKSALPRVVPCRERHPDGGPPPFAGVSRWIAVWALTALGAESESRNRIESALQQSYLSVTEHLDSIYQLVLDLLGYRLRHGLTMRQFTISAEALTEGLLLREQVNAEHFDGIKRPTSIGGEEQEWTLLGVTVDGLAEAFFELDPDWVPPIGVAAASSRMAD